MAVNHSAPIDRLDSPHVCAHLERERASRSGGVRLRRVHGTTRLAYGGTDGVPPSVGPGSHVQLSVLPFSLAAPSPTSKNPGELLKKHISTRYGPSTTRLRRPN